MGRDTTIRPGGITCTASHGWRPPATLAAGTFAGTAQAAEDCPARTGSGSAEYPGATTTGTSTTAAQSGRGERRRGGPRRQRVTGEAATQASAAALAAVEGTVRGVFRVRRSSTEGAVYAVVVRTADGSLVEVLEDASFTVLTTRTLRAPKS